MSILWFSFYLLHFYFSFKNTKFDMLKCEWLSMLTGKESHFLYRPSVVCGVCLLPAGCFWLFGLQPRLGGQSPVFPWCERIVTLSVIQLAGVWWRRLDGWRTVQRSDLCKSCDVQTHIGVLVKGAKVKIYQHWGEFVERLSNNGLLYMFC